MMVKTIFAGFGGQGVLMMGYTLAHGAMNAGFNVTYLPSYGAEVRGGTANCTVAVSDEEIASPIASEPHHAVIMNTPSLYTFQTRVASGGTLFLNASIINVEPSRHDVCVLKIPAADIASGLGNTRAANTVMLGAFLKKTGLFAPDIFLNSLQEVLGGKKKSVAELNEKAFRAGYEFTEASR
ncbi:MAG TPA: 2-oxoacid:acceptor oxidoreductase family protein [Magnetospirillaceae bacterium]|nr:2-oxoacid:acceptor oxidoreductase family protein [Magnetospirillaceae bacterium]